MGAYVSIRDVKSCPRVEKGFLAEMSPELSLPDEEREAANESRAHRGLGQEEPASCAVITCEREGTD